MKVTINFKIKLYKIMTDEKFNYPNINFTSSIAMTMMAQSGRNVRKNKQIFKSIIRWLLYKKMVLFSLKLNLKS